MKIYVKTLKHEAKTSQKSGKPYILQILTCELNGEVRNLKVYRENQNEMYPVGEYNLSPESFRVNDYGQLEIGFLNLVAVK